MNTLHVSFEHCSVLLERLQKALIDLGLTNDVIADITDLDVDVMAEELSQMFDKPSFERLFQTELGKGVIIGGYAQGLLALTQNTAEGEEQLEFDFDGGDDAA